MLSGLALVLLVAGGCCMEMRETVERMVMVRTTGSDLQPAATGYIYKKKNDGIESVVEMGESEVMEHLAKLYEQPKAFAAPIPIAKGRAIAKVEDEDKARTQNEDRIIPVKEKPEDHVDGIADVDYKKIFDEYLALYGDNKAYDDYVRSLGQYGDGLYDGYKGDEKHDDGGFEEYKKKHYGDGKAGDYHNEKYASYAYSEKDHKEARDGTKDYNKHYGHDHDSKGYGKNSAHDADDARAFHKIFVKDDQQHDDKIYGSKDEDGVHKFADGHKYHGANDRGYAKVGSYESGHPADFGRSYHDEGSGADENHSSEERDNSSEKHGDPEPKGRPAAGQSYGFDIKH